MFVPRDFIMDPETDDLLIDGTRIKNGMVVLVEDDNWRCPLDKYTNLPKNVSADSQDAALKQARKFNRWTTVTELSFVKGNNSLRFIGVYEDGQKVVFDHYARDSWYVKKDSLPVVAIDEALEEEESSTVIRDVDGLRRPDSYYVDRAFHSKLREIDEQNGITVVDK